METMKKWEQADSQKAQEAFVLMSIIHQEIWLVNGLCKSLTALKTIYVIQTLGICDLWIITVIIMSLKSDKKNILTCVLLFFGTFWCNDNELFFWVRSFQIIQLIWFTKLVCLICCSWLIVMNISKWLKYWPVLYFQFSLL